MNKEQQLIAKIVFELGQGHYDNPAMEEWLKEYAENKHLEKIIESFNNTPITFYNSTPFIEVPGMMYDQAEQELTGKHPDGCALMEVEMKIDRNRIEGYYETCPTSEFSEDRKIWTKVVMQSGAEYILNMPYKDFEKLLRPTTDNPSMNK